MANLRKRLARLLPEILSTDPSKAIRGVELAAHVRRVLADYTEDSIRVALSTMLRESPPLIARVDGGQGYYLLATTHISQPHQEQCSPDDELTQPGGSPGPKPPAPPRFVPDDALTNPGPIQLQVRSAFLDVIPRQQKYAVSVRVLLDRLRERLPGLNKNTLKGYFSRLVQERDIGVVKTADGLVFLEEASPPAIRPRRDQAETRKVRALEELFDASQDVALGIPATLTNVLQSDELFALRVLARTNSCRASELAERVARPIGRMAGMMRALKRKLHTLGFELFSAEALPDGETMYRYLHKELH